MGRLILPKHGSVYVDAQVIIYSVEKHPVYAPLLRPLWEAAVSDALSVVSSELCLMETLVGPPRWGDPDLISDYRRFFQRRGVRLLPITQDVLYEAARLRAELPPLRTPDAIHAATARAQPCDVLVTNDKGFRRIPGMPIVILDTL